LTVAAVEVAELVAETLPASLMKRPKSSSVAAVEVDELVAETLAASLRKRQSSSVAVVEVDELVAEAPPASSMKKPKSLSVAVVEVAELVAETLPVSSMKRPKSLSAVDDQIADHLPASSLSVGPEEALGDREGVLVDDEEGDSEAGEAVAWVVASGARAAWVLLLPRLHLKVVLRVLR
jgi:hypothetical protein